MREEGGYPAACGKPLHRACAAVPWFRKSMGGGRGRRRRKKRSRSRTRRKMRRKR